MNGKGDGCGGGRGCERPRKGEEEADVTLKEVIRLSL